MDEKEELNVKTIGRRKIFVVSCIIAVMVSVTGVQGIGRIDEFRTQFKENPAPMFPGYVGGVTESALYEQPTVHELFSWASDNAAWSAAFLADLQIASVEVDTAIEEWIGDKILVVFIDYRLLNGDRPAVFAATFNVETGAVIAEYEDTKTEVWASLEFVQDLLAFANANGEQETLDFAMTHYYEDWAVWVQMGFFDVLLTRESLEVLVIAGTAATVGVVLLRRKK